MVPPLSIFRNRLRMRHVQLLQALAEKGSLRAASEMIGITQPAATKALQELEDMVGTPLFVRHPRGLEPTPYGAAFTRYAKTSLEDLRALRSDLAAMENGNVGRVRIGAIMAAAAGFLTPAIVSLSASHPRLQLSVQVDTSDILVRALNDGLLDLVIGRIPTDWESEHLSFQPLHNEHLMLVARPNHPACASPPAERRDLADFPWILQASPSPMRQVIEKTFHEWGGVKPVAMIETSSILTTVSLLGETDMVAVVPDVVGRYFADIGALAPVPAPISGSLPNYGLILRSSRESTPAMASVIEVILREARAAASD
ncbi:MAG TPA: LysR substrate-binding domain-containing protein [Caulobacteraceae bacterium]|nr:LysR substrate-binding domain-containing protein [Caulobacteraceae bacterium]